MVEKVLSGLLRLENYHVAGELCQSQGHPDKAMQFYCKGNIYTKAVELARFVSPSGMLASYNLRLREGVNIKMYCSQIC